MCTLPPVGARIKSWLKHGADSVTRRGRLRNAEPLLQSFHKIQDKGQVQPATLVGRAIRIQEHRTDAGVRPRSKWARRLQLWTTSAL